jgi:HTH-type transcriptional regulator/antitoxin HipB
VASLSNVSTGFLVDFEKGKETAEIGKILHVLSTLGLEVVVSPRAALPRAQRGRP